MPLDFPNDPAVGDIFAGAGARWLWDGAKWTSLMTSGGPFLPLTGGELSGPLMLAADPAVALHAATKQYVDAGGSGYLPLTGGELSGPLMLAAVSTVIPPAGVGLLQGHAVNGTVIQGSGATHDIQFLNQAGTSVLALDAGTSNWGPFHVTATGALTSRSVQDRASDIYNVLDYGAVADAQVALTTATIAAGTTTLTVGASIFAVTDVGKAIGVALQAANANPKPWSVWTSYRTITGYTSPTQVTVSNVPDAGPIFGAFAGVPAVIVWGTENAAAFQAASDKINVAGRGALYVPGGRYLIGNTVYLYSNTTLRGDGSASEIVNAGISGTQGTGAYGPMFANYNGFNWPAGTSKKATPWVATTLANMIDHDIIVRDLALNYGAATAGGNSKGCLFILARKIKMLHCRITCPGLGGNALSAIGCWDIEETGNVTESTNIAFDHWGGIQKLRMYSNTINTIAGAVQAVNVNASGITPDEPNNTCDIVIHGNLVELNGGPAGAPVAFFLDALGGGGSVSQTIHITNNVIRALSGSNNQGIVWRGCGGRGTVAHNVLDGLDNSPILIGATTSSPGTLTTPWTINAGDTTALIAYPSHGVGATATNFEGPWLHSPSQTVGGITFTGIPYTNVELLVTQVVDANTLRVRLPSAALSSVVNGGLSGTYWISRGAPAGVSITDNTFIDPKVSAGTKPYLISVQGNGHHVGTNKVVFRDPANPTCAYAVIARVETWGGTGSMVARHQTGGDGTGPVAGYSGTGNVAWATANGGNQPVMADDFTATTAPIGDESTAVATTAFVAGAAAGTAAITLPDADTTLTTAQVERRMVLFSGTLTAPRTVTMPLARAFASGCCATARPARKASR